MWSTSLGHLEPRSSRQHLMSHKKRYQYPSSCEKVNFILTFEPRETSIPTYFQAYQIMGP